MAPCRRRSLRVFAAASLTDALKDVAARWEKAGHPAPTLAFGGSSALAKQIEAGAPADIFASADVAWMDYVDSKGKVAHAGQSARQYAGADRAARHVHSR